MGDKEQTSEVSALDQLKSIDPQQVLNTLVILKARAELDKAEYEKKLTMNQFRPSQIYPVMIYHDGLRWVCSYGVFNDQFADFLPDAALGQSGVVAYGDYPEQAMLNFDAMWLGSNIEETLEGEEAEDGELEDYDE